MMYLRMMIKSINELPEVPENAHIRSVLVSRNLEQAVSFYHAESNGQVLLLDPSALQLPIIERRTLILRAISSSMLDFNTLSLSRTEEIAAALAISTAFGMFCNNILAEFLFDLAKQNQKNDNLVFLAVMTCAIVLYGLVSSKQQNHRNQATQHLFRLFPNEELAAIQQDRGQNRLLQHIAGNIIAPALRQF